jgi:hypothetical protein
MDYAATPIQPVVQGLITITTNVSGGPVSFQGRGVSSIVRTPGSPNATGDFTLILDQGVPGTYAETPTPAAPAAGGVSTAPFDPRSLLTARGSPTNANPGASSIPNLAVMYGNIVAGAFVVAPVAGIGWTAIRVVCTTSAAVVEDPCATFANGVEIISWKGQ